VLLSDCTAEVIGGRLPNGPHQVTLQLVELLFGWVTESTALLGALPGVPITASAR
jgi:hypothetical protein